MQCLDLPESRCTVLYILFWYLNTVWGSTRVDLLHDWTLKASQDEDILCYQTLYRSHDADISVLVDTGQITGQIAGYCGQT